MCVVLLCDFVVCVFVCGVVVVCVSFVDWLCGLGCCVSSVCCALCVLCYVACVCVLCVLCCVLCGLGFVCCV